MSLGLVLDIAKTALAAQKYALNVTGHNIANVNTPGYSRQSPIMEAQEPSTYAGKVMGRGVLMNQIVRVCDQFIEDRLMQ
ncbi:MAG: flagellar hook-associated protein FlgK, partial [Desulfobacterales bacterium]|nr:flagellar hook-associated protein FlgK [Desulfobacterales bacterium]